jgi:hypothetical protein
MLTKETGAHKGDEMESASKLWRREERLVLRNCKWNQKLSFERRLAGTRDYEIL